MRDKGDLGRDKAATMRDKDDLGRDKVLTVRDKDDLDRDKVCVTKVIQAGIKCVFLISLSSRISSFTFLLLRIKLIYIMLPVLIHSANIYFGSKDVN